MATEEDNDRGKGGRGLSLTTRTEAGKGISSGNNSDMTEGDLSLCTEAGKGISSGNSSEMTEGDTTEAGRGISSGEISERMDADATGVDICTKGLGGVLDSIEGALMEGE